MIVSFTKITYSVKKVIDIFISLCYSRHNRGMAPLREPPGTGVSPNKARWTLWEKTVRCWS